MLRIACSAMTAALLLAGCGETAAENPEPDASAEESPTCPAYDPRNGSAVIDFMPDIVKPPVLKIQFLVDAPNDGDAYELEFESIQESAPPSYVFDLKRTETGMLRVITETSVGYTQSDFPEPELRSIVINCEGNRFFEIEPVEVVQ